jgi:hypothetical protein
MLSAAVELPHFNNIIKLCSVIFKKANIVCMITVEKKKLQITDSVEERKYP